MSDKRLFHMSDGELFDWGAGAKRIEVLEDVRDWVRQVIEHGDRDELAEALEGIFELFEEVVSKGSDFFSDVALVLAGRREP